MNKNNYSFYAVALGSAHVKFDFQTRPETGNLKVKKKTSWSLDSGSIIRKAWLLWEWGGGGGWGWEEKPEKPLRASGGTISRVDTLDMLIKFLFYSILFYSILFYSILFYSILFYSILFYSILFYSILFYSILFSKLNWCMRQCPGSEPGP